MTLDGYLMLGGLAVAGIIFFAIYFLPAAVAFLNSHPQKEAITVLNLLLGWTLVGWAVAMVWAFTQPNQNA